ncbi:transglycosylase [Aeromonas hydrophila NJ-35]|uniref:transglycosylase SLT domain-containing protein n=1 Tax=Aeromonas TaxID=642 RepID=UPI000640A57F|nr:MULTISPECIES: transglycosylase SLT domain-containing protein [Aeromonas]AKJ36906.1 transglycosylase [Aeromonas hydrophila NJ-35]ALZ82614.1 transglycosylase [Aeromonas hydrophila]QGW99166.1 lytic transglycosylase domain-containing protein [Aeromonas veronii]HDK8695686.1 transglycosylase SLT domain-containing protein [Aeromonas hydrophila]
MQRKATCAIMLASAIWSSSTYAINLSGTSFDKAAKRYKLDPLLVYSIALAESASGRGDGNVGPWQWTLRGPNGPFYGQNQQDTRAKFLEWQRLYGKKIDVGIMQVNLRWNGHRVASYEELLDQDKNIMTGTEVLSEAIESSPGDLELGIGRYHNWDDELRARNYGSRILAIWRNLRELE